MINGIAVPGANGITLAGSASGSTIEGLSIVNFHGGTGLFAPVVNTLIEGNDIGTNAIGSIAEPNGGRRPSAGKGVGARLGSPCPALS